MAQAAKSGKTTARKTAASKTGTRPSGRKQSHGRQNQSKGRDYEPEKEYGFMREEVFLIVSFALAVLLFLSNFHLCGVVGDWLRKEVDNHD